MPTSFGDDSAPWWDPLGLWPRAGSGVELVSPSSYGLPAWWNVPQTLFDLLRSRLVGKAVTFGDGQNAVSFTLTSLEASVGQVAAASGQVDDVSLAAVEVLWRSVPFERISLSLGNYHTRIRARPVVVAAPVDVSAVLTERAVADLLARVTPAWGCEITEGGELRLRGARRPDWGYLRVQPSVEDKSLLLRACAVGRGRRSWRLPRWPPPVRHRLALPDHVRLTGVEVGPREVVVHLRVDEWTIDLLGLLSWLRRPGAGGTA